MTLADELFKLNVPTLIFHKHVKRQRNFQIGFGVNTKIGKLTDTCLFVWSLISGLLSGSILFEKPKMCSTLP